MAEHYASEFAAMATARRKGDHAAADRHKSEARTRQIEAYVEKILADSPPLSEEQRERVAALLRTGGAK